MVRGTTRFILALALLLCGCASEARWTLQEDNDYFTLFNKDTDYTQGLIVTRTDDDGSIQVGQKIYTPLHKHESAVVEDERPYAGYLYARQDIKREWTPELPGFWGYELGLVGPGAGGKFSQCSVHALLGQKCPNGWANQLSDEPGITLRAGVDKHDPVDLWILKGDNRELVTLEVGNISTALRSLYSIQWGTPNLYYFAGPRFNLVARDIFLDGNTWRSSHSVDKKPFYAELIGGIGMKRHDYSIAWTLTISSPTYDQQSSSYNYGSVTIGW